MIEKNALLRLIYYTKKQKRAINFLSRLSVLSLQPVQFFVTHAALRHKNIHSLLPSAYCLTQRERTFFLAPFVCRVICNVHTYRSKYFRRLRVQYYTGFLTVSRQLYHPFVDLVSGV